MKGMKIMIMDFLVFRNMRKYVFVFFKLFSLWNIVIVFKIVLYSFLKLGIRKMV